MLISQEHMNGCSKQDSLHADSWSAEALLGELPERSDAIQQQQQQQLLQNVLGGGLESSLRNQQQQWQANNCRKASDDQEQEQCRYLPSSGPSKPERATGDGQDALSHQQEASHKAAVNGHQGSVSHSNQLLAADISRNGDRQLLDGARSGAHTHQPAKGAQPACAVGSKGLG